MVHVFSSVSAIMPCIMLLPLSSTFGLFKVATSDTNSTQAIQVYTNKRKRPREIESGLYRPLHRCLASNRTAALSLSGTNLATYSMCCAPHSLRRSQVSLRNSLVRATLTLLEYENSLDRWHCWTRTQKGRHTPRTSKDLKG